MKSSHRGSVAALSLILALGLTACGGKASFDVSGSISGLNNPGLVLANGDSTVAPASGATSFTFPNSIDYGTSYNITFQHQPDHMTCLISNASGSAGHTTEIRASVSCAQNSYTLGGTVSGLTVDGLVLTNGSVATPVTLAANATTFVFANAVPVGTTYGVSVLTNPAGLVCGVTGGTAVMGDAAVNNVAVACVPAT